jgi:tetratricopeptide (TPR) repeat protein
MWTILPVLQPLNKIAVFRIIMFYILCLSTCFIQYVDKIFRLGRWSRAGFALVMVLFLTVQAASGAGNEKFPLKYIPAELDRAIRKAEQLVMERRYGEAESLFDELEREQAGRLLPSMGRLLVLLTHFLEQGAPAEELERRFQREVSRNRRVLKEMEVHETLNAWDHLLIGGSLGAQGLYELEHKNYFKAFIQGLKALSHLKKVQRLDPEVFDIHFAMGLYKYYRSVKTRYLWFLPMVSDQRQEGIEDIEMALVKGHYAVPGCKIALVLLAEKEGKNEQGIRLGEKYLMEYPKCKLIRDAVISMKGRLRDLPEKPVPPAVNSPGVRGRRQPVPIAS